jgi:hypothetical protein
VDQRRLYEVGAAGAAWTAWSEWTHAAEQAEADQREDFFAGLEADMEARRN